MAELHGRKKRKLDNMLAEIRDRCQPLVIGLDGDSACWLHESGEELALRGIFLNPPEEWVGLDDMTDRLEFREANAVLYGLRSAMNLLLACDPRVIDLLGLRPEHTFVRTDAWRMILANTDAFLSRQAVDSFVSYVEKRRKSIQVMLSQGERDKKKLSRELAHLIRVYSTGAELLRDHVVVPYRETERELLADIRAGKYLDRKHIPVPDFMNVLEEYRGSLYSAVCYSNLPEQPDRKRINDLTMRIVTRDAILGGYANRDGSR